MTRKYIRQTGMNYQHPLRTKTLKILTSLGIRLSLPLNERIPTPLAAAMSETANEPNGYID
jgi:hypothetical protein